MVSRSRKAVETRIREEEKRLGAGIAAHGAEKVTHGTQGHLHVNFIESFYSVMEEWESFGTIESFYQQYDLIGKNPETDTYMLQGLFGMGGENILDEVILGKKIDNAKEAKIFLTYSLKTNLIGNEGVHPKALTNILNGLSDYNFLFTDNAINTILDSLLFEANQIYMGVDLKRVENEKAYQLQGEDKSSANLKGIRDTLSSLQVFAKRLTTFLETNKQLSKATIRKCNSFVEKFYPKEEGR